MELNLQMEGAQISAPMGPRDEDVIRTCGQVKRPGNRTVLEPKTKSLEPRAFSQ